jgi:DNA ligase 1
MNIKPILAATLKNTKDLKFPCICTPKLDGCRGLLKDKQILSRSLKLIPNLHVQSQLAMIDLPQGLILDGELLSGKFNECQSSFMTITGIPSFTYWVFDAFINPDMPYIDRLKLLESLKLDYPFVKIVPFCLINSLEQFEAKEQKYLSQGYEGIMIRSLEGVYKFGRSTVKEGILLKFKRFEDGESEVLGYDLLCKNMAESTINALGLKEKSHRLEDRVEQEAIGCFHVRDVHSGIEFSVSTGMTKQQREDFYKIRDSLIGKIVNYKYQKVELNKPRFPVFRGFRDKIDF